MNLFTTSGSSPTGAPSTGFPSLLTSKPISFTPTPAPAAPLPPSAISNSVFGAAGFKPNATAPAQPITTNPTPQPVAVAGYNPNSLLQTQGADSAPQGSPISTPSNFTINTDNLTSGDISNPAPASAANSTYAQYVQNLAQASQYSPAYLSAYNQSQTLGAQEAQLQGNLAAGIAPGDTEGFAEGFTNRALMGAVAQKSYADIALQTQALARQGNIAGAQALVQGTQPVSVSPGSSLVSPFNGTTTYNGIGGLTGVNAVDQYNTLQQQYPGAGIPPYNSNLTPAQNQQIAQSVVANSPQYKAQFLSTYTTPGGGTGLFSKINTNGLQQNADGTIALVPAAAAALGSANANIINTQLGNLSTINVAIQSSSATLATTQQFMQQYGLNDGNTPIVTQIENGIKDQTTQQGAVAALKNDLTALRSDYSQYLVARGGSVAGSGPDSPEVLQAIPDTVSITQLSQVVGQMQAVGNNTAAAVNTQIQTALSSLGGGSSTGGSSPTNPFAASNFFGK
jgi:hypothetical protein